MGDGQLRHVYLISSSNNAGVMEDEEFGTLTEAQDRYIELDAWFFTAGKGERDSNAEKNPSRVLILQHFLRRS